MCELRATKFSKYKKLIRNVAFISMKFLVKLQKFLENCFFDGPNWQSASKISQAIHLLFYLLQKDLL